MTVQREVRQRLRTYRVPKLSRYGDLRSVTLAVANNTMNLDGGTMDTQKTG
jgi:hypothetical protein